MSCHFHDHNLRELGIEVCKVIRLRAEILGSDDLTHLRLGNTQVIALKGNYYNRQPVFLAMGHENGPREALAFSLVQRLRKGARVTHKQD